MMLLAALLAAASLQPSDFAFAHVGVTTPSDAVRQRGAPDLEYDAWTVRGRIDWFIAPPSEESIDRIADQAKQAGKKLEQVRVLEWDDPDEPSRSARLVFDGGVLWYALLPVSASETTPQQVADRVGHPATEIVDLAIPGDVRAPARVYGWRERGLAYIAFAPGRLDRGDANRAPAAPIDVPPDPPRFAWKAIVPQ